MTAIIGGTPTASGGTVLYTYCWSMTPITFTGSSTVLTASDILNDTTVANPIVDFGGGTFYLKITDALGCVSYDTCKVSFSLFIYTLWNYTYLIDEGFYQ